MFASGRSHLRFWGVTKLVSEPGLEVDDSTCVHLAADLCWLQMLLWGSNNEGT